MEEIVKSMLDAGMVERSRSEYVSPVLLVKKADGSFRFVIDYRKLNSQTVRMNYPLPLIDDILDSVCSRRVYSCFDLYFGATSRCR